MTWELIVTPVLAIGIYFSIRNLWVSRSTHRGKGSRTTTQLRHGDITDTKELLKK